MKKRCILTVSAIALLIGLAPAGATAATAKPTLSLGSQFLVPSHSVTITGTAWPAGSSFQASICGASAAQGSVDCANSDAVTFSPGPGGTFTAVLPVVIPPQPCPCVVMVVSLEGYQKLFPVFVADAAFAPVVPLDPLPRHPLSIVRVRISGGTSVGSLLGISAPRTLEVTVRDNGPVSTGDPALAAVWGRGSGLTHAISLPHVPSLRPGQTREVQASFDLGPLSAGAYEVKVHLEGGAGDTAVGNEASATTTTWPYGLAALFLIGMALLMYQRRAAGRRPVPRPRGRHVRTDPSPGHPSVARDQSCAAAAGLEPTEEWNCFRCCSEPKSCTIRFYDVPSAPPMPDVVPDEVATDLSPWRVPTPPPPGRAAAVVTRPPRRRLGP